MRPAYVTVLKTQMTEPQEYTDAFIIIKKLFLGGLRGLQSNSIQYERPCMVSSILPKNKRWDNFQYIEL